MNSIADPKVTRYRPTSWGDFKTYAANLAWLLQGSKLGADDILARIYGYSDARELHQTLKRPGVAGPEEKPAAAYDRVFRVLREARTEEGRDELSERDLKATELGLFLSPVDHKQCFKRVKLMLQVQYEEDVIDLTMTAGHYATVVRSDEEPEEARLHFTDIGEAVFSAAMNVVPDPHASPPKHEVSAAIHKLEALMARHPKNPWLHAIYVYSFAKFDFQDGWADNMPRRHAKDRGTEYARLDADPGYLRYAQRRGVVRAARQEKHRALR